MNKTIWKKNLLLVALVVVIAAVPLYFLKDAEFGGADGEAMGIIEEAVPGYTVWAEPFLEPASGEIESMLFALQAAVGAGIVGFVLGRVTARGKTDDRD